MQLLTPDDIKQQKIKGQDESRRRSIMLADEESKQAKLLNLTRQHADEQKKEIAEDLEKFKVEVGAEKAVLIAEVTDLEERKREALKPINEIQKEAENRLATAKEKEADLAKREAALATDREALAERIDAVVEREEENAQKADDLDRRASNLEKEEARAKESEIELSKKWVVYHETATKSSATLDKKAQELALRERAIEIRAEEQNARDRALDDRESNLHHRYAALEAAIREHKRNGIDVE